MASVQLAEAASQRSLRSGRARAPRGPTPRQWTASVDAAFWALVEGQPGFSYGLTTLPGMERGVPTAIYEDPNRSFDPLHVDVVFAVHPYEDMIKAGLKLMERLPPNLRTRLRLRTFHIRYGGTVLRNRRNVPAPEGVQFPVHVLNAQGRINGNRCFDDEIAGLNEIDVLKAALRQGADLMVDVHRSRLGSAATPASYLIPAGFAADGTPNNRGLDFFTRAAANSGVPLVSRPRPGSYRVYQPRGDGIYVTGTPGTSEKYAAKYGTFRAATLEAPMFGAHELAVDQTVAMLDAMLLLLVAEELRGTPVSASRA